MKLQSKSIYLLPTTIGDNSISFFTGNYLMNYYKNIAVYICENEKASRAFFKSIGTPIPQDKLFFLPTSKAKSAAQDIRNFIEEHKESPIGLISDAGLPCVADPGNKAVQIALKMGFQIYPVVGPSSILLALMASGCNGQQFAFHGYLPIKDPQKKQAIKQLQDQIKKNGQTQLFIETPYRNDQMLSTLLKYCSPNLVLSISVNLMSEKEYSKTMTIQEWKKEKHIIGKVPCVFVLGSH